LTIDCFRTENVALKPILVESIFHNFLLVSTQHKLAKLSLLNPFFGRLNLAYISTDER